MALHAGFAAVATVTEQFANQALQVVWNQVLPPVNVPLPASVTVGSATVTISGSLAMAAPTVTLQANPGNTVTTDLVFAGALVLQSGSTVQTVDAVLHARLSLGVVATQSLGKIVVGLALSNAQVSAVDIFAIAGGPLSAAFQTALSSPQVLGALTTAVQSVPPQAVQFQTPLPAAYTFAPPYSPTPPQGTSYFPLQLTLFRIALTVSRIVLVPLDHALDVAVDFAGLTQGDPASLVDLTQAPVVGAYQQDLSPDSPSWQALGGTPIAGVAVITNGSMLGSLVGNQISPQTSGEFPFDRNTQLNSLGPLTFGYVTPPPVQSPPLFGGSVQGSVNYWLSTVYDPNTGYHPAANAVSVGASFTAYVDATLFVNSANPNFIGTWDVQAVGLDISSPEADVLAAVAAFTGIVVLGITFLPIVLVGLIAALDGVIPGYLASVATSTVLPQLQSGITRVALTPSDQTGTIPGTTQPIWEHFNPGMEFNPDGPRVWASWADPANQPFLTANGYNFGAAPWPPGYPQVIRGEVEKQATDYSPIVATLNLPGNGFYSPNDPTLRVTWQTTRGDNSQVLYSADLPANAPGALTTSITNSSAALQAVSSFTISCTLYRQFGYRTETILQSEIEVAILDFVDRSHKFVQWSHPVWFLPPRAAPPYWSRSRNSRIHRTDVPLRCLIMQHPQTPPKKGGGLSGGPVYLDQIPFPSSQLAQKRHGLLCDYCFFGGPTSTTPKIPPGQTLQQWFGS